jgi:hypothetical protein
VKYSDCLSDAKFARSFFVHFYGPIFFVVDSSFLDQYYDSSHQQLEKSGVF